LTNTRSTVAIKPSQITLSPKYKEFYQNVKRRSTNVIDVETPVESVTAVSGTSNTRSKIGKQPVQTVVRNTQGLQGSIYSNSNSIDVRAKIVEDEQKQIRQVERDEEKKETPKPYRVRLKKQNIEMVKSSGHPEGKVKIEGNSPNFQHQFEMQNDEEEN